MPPRPKTAKRAVAAVPPQPPSTGTFARLEAEAKRRLPEIPPYVIDDVDPPIVIQAPSSIEQQIGLSELFGAEGDFNIRDARHILELLCGDAFPALWQHIKGQHITFLVALIREMGEHFGGFLRTWDAGDLPGGSKASSS